MLAPSLRLVLLKGMPNEGTFPHGINRFPVFIDQVDKGQIKLNAEPECVNSMGAQSNGIVAYGLAFLTMYLLQAVP
ncbi:hypothetical protein O9993_11870 [Vibrio lentus]|nr:hypothetical protein [Vibrio lentus]